MRMYESWLLDHESKMHIRRLYMIKINKYKLNGKQKAFELISLLSPLQFYLLIYR